MKTRHWGIIMLTSIWLIVSWYSLAYMNSASIQMDGGCPLMSHETTFCPMTLAQHIDRWQSAFLGIAPLLLILSIGIFFTRRNFHDSELTPYENRRQRWRRHSIFIVRPLARFLIRGLMQPILYA